MPTGLGSLSKFKHPEAQGQGLLYGGNNAYGWPMGDGDSDPILKHPEAQGQGLLNGGNNAERLKKKQCLRRKNL
ncbi:hypothetical protein [Sulfurimonas sp.]|uniref:hypothetical protein n=1 Tax=Sulfurimonas sp. TaxID=2022749 RepID=UPI0035625DB2